MTSRNMPALLTRMSMRPKALSAVLTIASAFFGSVIESVEAIARPSAFSIARTTSCAGPASEPSPCRLAPISQTTTRAPSCASSMAMPRPIPRPPPVTIAVLPLTMSGMRRQILKLNPFVPAKAGTYPYPNPPDSRLRGMNGVVSALAPNLFRELDNHPQLRPLLFFIQHITFLGRGKAALRREAQLIERNELARFLDTAMDFVPRLEPPAFRGDQAENDGPVLRQYSQWFEASGSRGVVLHEEAVDLDLVEQDFLHGFVATHTHIGGFIIAAAHVHGDRHVGGNIRHRGVDEIAVQLAKLFRIIATVFHRLPIFWIAKHGDEYFIKLEISAAGIGEGTHRLPVGLAEIVEKAIKIGIDIAVDRRRYWSTVSRRRRRNRDFRRALGVRGDELEMLKHRMAGKADLAGDLETFVAGRHPRESDTGIHHVFLDAVETPEEIQVPPGAPEFAISDRLQAGIFLLFDDALDLAVLDFLELCRTNFALGAQLS